MTGGLEPSPAGPERADVTGPRPSDPTPSTGPDRPLPDARLLRRVRWQLVAWSGGATLLVLLVLGALLYWSVANSLAQNSIDQLRARGDPIVAAMGRGGPLDPRILGLVFGGQGAGTIVFGIDPQGTAVGPTDLDVEGLPDPAGVAAARANGTDVRTATVRTNGTDVRTPTAGDIPVRVYSAAVTRPGGQWVIQVIGDRTAEAATLDRLLVILLLGGLVAVLVAGAAGFLYAGRALVPIRDSLRRQREFAADASHELRTPLTVIRASVEHLRRHPRQSVATVGTALEDIEAEVDRLTHLVDDLLLLARADSGAVELERQPLDLADVAADALGPLTQLAGERKVSLVLDPEPAPTTGDAGRLGQVVGILVDNAVRHSPPTGTVLVRTRGSRDGASLVVEDEGPGIRGEDAAHIFDRFWRAPGAPEGGTGLGLAIARWVVERHGGTIGVEGVAPHGARFTVRLPA